MAVVAEFGNAPVDPDPTDIVSGLDFGPAVGQHHEHVDVLALIDATDEMSPRLGIEIGPPTDIARPNRCFGRRWRISGGGGIGGATALGADCFFGGRWCGRVGRGGDGVSSGSSVDHLLRWGECRRWSICRCPWRGSLI